MRRYVFTLLFVGLVFLPLYLYIGWRLEHSPLTWVLSSLPFLLIITFYSRRVGHVLVHITYLSMGFISYLLFFTLLRDAVYLLTGHLFHKGAVFVLTFLSIIIGFIKASQGARVKVIKVPVPDLPETLEGFKIAQISDLHVGPTIKRRYVEDVVKKTNSLHPNIIALTGDIGDGPVDRFRDDIEPMKNLYAESGVFYVPGNHEYYWNANEWLNVMNNLKAIVLLNRGKKINVKGDEVLIAGVSDPVSVVKPDPTVAYQAGSDAKFKILLSHRPGIANTASHLGFDLQLSGHTHGGQFFPWTLVVRLVHEFHQGLYQVGKMWIYVSTGTGSWGPLLRLGTTPEISLIELIRSHKSLGQGGLMKYAFFIAPFIAMGDPHFVPIDPNVNAMKETDMTLNQVHQPNQSNPGNETIKQEEQDTHRYDETSRRPTEKEKDIKFDDQ